jgi:nitrile hydratase beta subunit
MNGAHDMGGTQGFGPVVAEVDEPAFHAEWERRVFALTIALGASGEWNIDASRSAREDRPPPEYLDMSYFELWLAGLERLVENSGMLERPPAGVLAAEDVAAAMARGGPASRPAPREARFAIGDRVRTRNTHPRGHTRLPRYARGRVGTVELIHGCHVFPDSNARFAGEDPQWLYTVRFSAQELWGTDAAQSVSIDAFEPYLEAA